MSIYSEDPQGTFRKMRQSGLTLPSEPIASRLESREILSQGRSGSMASDVGSFYRGPSQGRRALGGYGAATISREMISKGDPESIQRIQDMVQQRTGSVGAGGRSDAVLAHPKYRDPLESFKDRAWWWLEDDDWDKTLKRLRKWCRLLTSTHHLIPSLVTIYARFPLLDIELTHEDPKLADWYNQVFFDELHYDEHLYRLAFEYWGVGEVFSLGSWNEGIGCWDDDEIINPDDVDVAKNRALRTYQFHIKVPEGIRKVIEDGQPREEYEVLTQVYPHLVQWAKQDKEIPVSDIRMKHLKFEMNPWNERGVPILLRAMRQLQLEESLNAAQEAVADRLYSPLILAKLGLDGVDEDGPWVPEPSELAALRDDLAVALLSDFRLMVYHHGLEVENVFGREQMPRMNEDFDRVDAKLMQVFGVGRELLEGGQSGVPYASGALNRDILSQNLSSMQGMFNRFLMERFEVVAEAQEHYEYEKRGDTLVPVMERVLMQDEETGEQYIEERPKLALPKVVFRSVSMKDETTERDFLMQLQQSGFPVSAQALMTNIPFDWKEMAEQRKEEKVTDTLTEMEFRRDLFKSIYRSRQNPDPQEWLPVPDQYVTEYAAWETGMVGVQTSQAAPGTGTPTPTPNIAQPGGTPPAGPGAPMMPPTVPLEEDGEGESRPKESDEQRKGMPKPSTKRVIREAAKSDKEMALRIKVGNIDLPTPDHMKARRMMRVPEGTVVYADSGEKKEPEVPKALSYTPEQPSSNGDGNHEEG